MNKKCDKQECKYNGLFHVHFEEDNLDVIEYSAYTIIHDLTDNIYHKINKFCGCNDVKHNAID